METREATSNYRLSQRAKIIQERTESEELVENFCLRKGISRHKYYYWQQKLRKAAGEQLSKLDLKQTDMSLHGFTEVQITEPLVPSSTIGYDRICVEIGSCRISAGNGYSTDALVQILREVMKPC